MKRALEFLRTHKEVAFATVGTDHKPKLRVFQIMKIEPTALYFVTSPRKEVYRQLQADPAVEILAMAGDISVRISGNACFDVTDETAREVYESNPVLPRLYTRYTDLAYFRLPIAKLDYYNLSTDPPTLDSYTCEERIFR